MSIKRVDSGQGPVVVMEDDPDEILLSRNARFLEILKESKESIEEDGGISSSEMRRRLGIPKRRSSR